MKLGVEAALVRGELVPGDIDVEDGVVTAVGLPNGTRGCVAVPGFVDLQVNGYAGVDFLAASRADFARAGDALLEGGVTAYQPTYITAPEETLLEALRELPDNGSSSVSAMSVREYMTLRPLRVRVIRPLLRRTAR